MINSDIAARRFPDAPARILALPIDHRGFPVPWFVAWIDTAPDFRVVGPGKVAEAHNKGLCWICGERLGAFKAFVVGPMCAINRTSSEPPSHVECAQFAARACPFLTQPAMRRNEKNLPGEAQEPAGVMIRRNPGVALVWVTKAYKPWRAGDGVLFDIGVPERCEWYAHGRPATRDEVAESITSGLPLLRAEAAKGGERHVNELRRRTLATEALLPA